MKCPHCTVSFFDNWNVQQFVRNSRAIGWWYQVAACPACKEWIIEVTQHADANREPFGWRMIYPISTSRGPVPTSVPAEISEDYLEACNVLSISPKASAALSRRCLQNILRSHGYKAKQLWQEIDLLLGETDTSKVIPTNLRLTIDAIRHFGNFSAHPTEDVTTLQILAVEDDEAQWCLQILEDMFEHFYVRPADAALRKAALDAKLAAAGKLPSK
jgi:Domain of unknown function (DUF4145)